MAYTLRESGAHPTLKQGKAETAMATALPPATPAG
ncbi:hypothetical protein Rrhod_2557 [Rhodococcus rhodnii LMG 5362]|uniref:Uncharacterized protein n=1 Tax=Rhodococcus rhodnii LMG 5362 TaxID=1273125 RepID=R7WLJ4_9NOCA|nr:hypothetical protein Rrhod_2557 [Rhodococcus rhodnii LMG 5362]